MKFSVLVPVYNTSQYLEQCLTSLVDQTFDDFEVIIVNDGSTDNSKDICDKYQSEYPEKITVINQENQGLIAARRNAIKVAKGEYCIFVDSDDYIQLTLLEKVNDSINEYNTDVLIYSFRYVRDGVESESFKQIAEEGKIWTNEDKYELYEKMLTSNDVTSIWTKAVKTKVLKKDQTDYTLFKHKNMAEDFLQTMAIFTYADTIGYKYIPEYMYRINNNSVSRSFRPQTIYSKNTIHVYDKAKEYLEIWGLNDKEHNEKLNARWFNESMYMFSTYMENAKNKEAKFKVINADWNSLIPDEVKILRNEYENKVYQELYDYLKEKNYKMLFRYFRKKKIISKIKRLKSKVKNAK